MRYRTIVADPPWPMPKTGQTARVRVARVRSTWTPAALDQFPEQLLAMPSKFRTLVKDGENGLLQRRRVAMT